MVPHAVTSQSCLGSISPCQAAACTSLFRDRNLDKRGHHKTQTIMQTTWLTIYHIIHQFQFFLKYADMSEIGHAQSREFLSAPIPHKQYKDLRIVTMGTNTLEAIPT